MILQLSSLSFFQRQAITSSLAGPEVVVAADETQEDWVGFGRARSSGGAVSLAFSSSTYLGGAIGPALARGKPPPSLLLVTRARRFERVRREALAVCNMQHRIWVVI